MRTSIREEKYLMLWMVKVGQFGVTIIGTKIRNYFGFVPFATKKSKVDLLPDSK